MKGLAVSLLRARRPIFESQADAAEKMQTPGVQTRGSAVKDFTTNTPVNNPARGSGLQTQGIKAGSLKPNEGPRLLHFTPEEVKGLEPYMSEQGEIVLEVTGTFEKGNEPNSVRFRVNNVGYAPDNGQGSDDGSPQGGMTPVHAHPY